jgi:hypothetical protein
VLYPLDLIDDHLNIVQKPARIVVMQDIHVDPLIATSKERIVVLLRLNTTADRCEDECTRKNGLQISPWHL